MFIIYEIPAILPFFILFFILAAIIGFFTNIGAIITFLMECSLFILTPIMMLLEIFVLFTYKGKWYHKILLVLSIIIQGLLAFVPFRIYHDTSLKVNEMFVVGFVLLIVLILAFCTTTTCLKEDKKHLNIYVSVNLVLIIVGIFTILWSYGCHYYNYSGNNNPDPGYTSYIVNHEFKLYENDDNSTNNNQLIATYPVGSEVVSSNGEPLEIKTFNFSEDGTVLVAFIGEVELKDSNQSGYIAVFGSPELVSLYNQSKFSDNDSKKEEAINQLYISQGTIVTYQQSYLYSHETILKFANPIYENFDLLGIKSSSDKSTTPDQQITN